MPVQLCKNQEGKIQRTEYHAGEYDVVVIGAGHAGIEAGLAASRLGCKTAIFTISVFRLIRRSAFRTNSVIHKACLL